MVDGVDFMDDVDAGKDHQQDSVHFVRCFDKSDWFQLPNLGWLVG
jgi:hypothetical protein